ncbi:holin [Listeria phage LIS04]|nr:holin [Listeria phage LIS04]
MDRVPNLDPKMVARLVISALALLNMILGLFGVELIPIDEDAINKAVSTILVVITVGWSIWKDNDITKEARQSKSSNKE